MMSLSFSYCSNCNSNCFQAGEGLAFYATHCFFCGRSYTCETIVDEDYYIAIAERRFPERKESYVDVEKESGGKGSVYITAKNDKGFEGRFEEKNDRIEWHLTSNFYGKGIHIPIEEVQDLDALISEIKTNPSIDEEKSYVARYDGVKFEILLGDEERFEKERS